MPRGHVGEAGIVGSAIAGVGQAAFDVAEAFREAQRATDLSNYSIEAARQLNDLELEYNNMDQPDPGQFVRSGQEIRGAIEARIDDTVVKRMFVNEFNKTLLYKEFNIKRIAREKFVDHSRATLDQNLVTLRGLASSAKTREERTHLIYRGKAAVAGRMAAGVISKTDAVNLHQKFLGDLQVDQARADILADPVTAARYLTDPEKYPGIPENIRLTLLERAQHRADALDREAVRQDDKLQTRLRKVREDIVKDNDFSAWQAAIAGTLTGAQLNQMANDREISLTAFKGIHTFWEAKEDDIENDPVIVGEITEQITLGRPVDERMNNALANGQLEPGTYISMKQAIASTVQKQGLAYIANALKPSPADQFAYDKHLRYAEANQRYLQLVKDGMEPMEASRRVVDGYRSDLQRSYKGLSSPMYMPPAGDKRNYSDLDQAEIETVKQHALGNISDRIYIDQMNVISELKALINEINDSDQAAAETKKLLKKRIKE